MIYVQPKYNMSVNEGQLVEVLEKTVSLDKAELERSQKFLDEYRVDDFPQFIKLLSDVLRNVGNSAISRMAAGLIIKNTVTSKEAAAKDECQQRWLEMNEDIRDYIRKNIVEALGTEVNRPSTAAQCVAYIAVIELSHGQWQDIINVLCTKVVNPASSENLREASLEAIGYICQDIDYSIVEANANNILTAIIHGMRKTETSQHVQLAATTALLNSLEFTRANFDKDTERNYIMEVVCEATQSNNDQVKVAALQCLVKIMTLYYKHMEPYMAQALFPITIAAMRSDMNEVALQGIEFWSNVADEEVDLAIEGSEATDLGLPPQRVSRFYAKGALQFLIPILMEKLTQQDENDDEDEWNPCKAASVCLMLFSQCCEDDVIPHILPFVKENIKSPNWRNRDAALMAFGSMLSGLDGVTIKPLVETAMPTIIELMYDPNVVVRDTAAWTIGRICELMPGSSINLAYLKPLLEAMVNGLKAEPRVAANVCWAFTGLADAAYEAAGGSKDDLSEPQPETYCLSQYFELLIDNLLATTNRPDAGQGGLRSAAYEALMEMIKNSPKDCYAVVQKTTLIILEKLNHVLQLEGHLQSNTDKSQVNDLQGLLCATLQSVLKKMSPEDAPKISDSIMSALLRMFSSNSKSGGVQEDAMLAVSTLVEVLGENFIKYMDAFKPYLYIGLKNHNEYQVCLSAVGVVGDICRALKLKIAPFCDEIMMLLIQNLGDNSVHRTVKPQILSLFGDIALAVGVGFKKYLDVVFTTLLHAAQAQVDRSDFEMIEYLNELRLGILEAYTGIVQGLKGDDPGNPNGELVLIEPHVPYIAGFIKLVALDEETNECCVVGCVGLIGDLCTSFGAKILNVLDGTSTTEIIQKARRSRASKTKAMGNWAWKELRKLQKSFGMTAVAN